MSNSDQERPGGESSQDRSPEDDRGLGELGDHLAAHDDIDNMAQEARLFQRMFGKDEVVRLGRWTLREHLGRGASGSVYAADDPKMKRKVALKVLKPRLDVDPEAARQRLLREAEALAQISHSNVVHVYDVESDGDEVYLVMEYVDGSSLRDWQRAEHDLDEILDVYLQAARGLACLHAAGLVHRDFKPENVLVDRDGRAVVIDLGLVHAVSQGIVPAEVLPEGHGSELDRAITRTGARLGTVGYMAPEQLRGQDPDPYIDQFAFCVALYEAVAGVRPFADGDGTFAGQLAIIERGDIQPPAGEMRVPSWLIAMLRRGLSMRPEDRFPNMEALVRAIERGRRKRWPWIAAGVGVIALALLVGSLLPIRQESAADCTGESQKERDTLWGDMRKEGLRQRLGAAGVPEGVWRQLSNALDHRADRWKAARALLCEERAASRALEEPSLAHQRAACLTRERAFFDGVVTELTIREFSPGQLYTAIEAVHRELRRRSDCVELDQICEPPGKEIESQIAQAHRALDEAARSELFGAYERAEQQTRQALAAADALSYPPLRAEARYQLGHVLGSRGADKLALQDMREAADLAADHCHRDVEADAQIYAAKVIVTGEAKNVPLAREYVSVARNVLLRLDELGPEHLDLVGDLPAYQALLTEGNAEPRYPRLAEYLETRGLIAQREAQYELAIAWHERALAVRERLQPPDPWLVSKSLNNLGNALVDAGRGDDAWPHLQRAIELRANLLGPSHPLVAQMHYNIGRAAMRRGDYEHGRQALTQALDVRSKIHGSDSPELLPTLMALGELERESGQHARAEEIAGRIATMHRRLREVTAPDARAMVRVHEHSLLAAVHQKHGRLAEALVEIERAIEILEAHDACATPGESGGDYVWALHDAGELAIELRRWPVARERLEQARSMYPRCSPEDQELAQTIEKNLARVPRTAGRSR
jgi:tetratricopeptide (TPR) repeat protein